MENKLIVAAVLTLSMGLVLASTSSAQPLVMAQNNATGSLNNTKISTNGSNQSSQSQGAKPAATANQLEQMGNNTAFLAGGATISKKPNVAQGLSMEQNSTAGPTGANMTAQKQPESPSRSNASTTTTNMTSTPQTPSTSNASTTTTNMTSTPQTPSTSNASKTAGPGSNASVGANNTKGGLAQMNQTASSAVKPTSTNAGPNSSNPNSNNLFAKVGEALKSLFGGGKK
jgi:hypothetical protein